MVSKRITPAPGTAAAEQPEELPSAAAFLTVSPLQVQAAARVPAPQAHTLITVFASLGGLAIMGVLAPAVTLSEGKSILTPGQIVFFLTLELVIAVVVAAVPYTVRR
jgi:hypothetical protein